MSDVVQNAIALAVDLGGTKVEAALVDGAGAVLTGSRHRRPTGSSATSESLEDAVIGAVRAALSALPAGARLEGGGIGAAGPINLPLGAVSPLNMPAWRDYPLRDLVGSLLPADASITLRMDGLCIALAEHWVGAGREADNVLGMVVSTGIGGGLILAGRPLAGPTGNAGHIGHIEVGGFDDLCLCGGVGCVEAVASGPRTVAWARAQGFAGTTGEDLAAAYAAGDDIATRAIARSGRAIGQAIASATALADIDVVAIGGGFSQVTPDLFDHIRAAVASRAEFDFVTKTRVVPSGLSGTGPLLGAAALVHRAAHVPAT